MYYQALCLALLLTLTAAAQPKKMENCLLWRITGNGLSKPSWLYGTIHLTDKQVFDFGDAVYAALESCEGYAMEIAPDSIISNAFQELRDDQVLLKQELSAADYARIQKKLREQFKKDPATITVKEFRTYFINKVNKIDKNSMHTIMDAWFYDAMRRQGKWVGGVEDVHDQDGADNFVSLSDYVDDFLDDNRKSKEMLSKMIAIYKRQDLEAIAGFDDSEKFLMDSVMLRRNRKMARRMDSLAHVRSSFFAVGTAHLPGDSGVISHLRRRGFTVEPIRSGSTIHATAYHFEEKELPWITVQASNGQYTVQMPGAPQDMGATDENMDMKIHADIGSNLFYITVSATGRENLSVDSVVAMAIQNVAKKAKVLSIKPIRKDSVEGREVLAKGDDAHYRIQCYYRSPIIYMALVGSSVDTLLQSKDAGRFLGSLVMHHKTTPAYEPWSVYRNGKHGFSVRFPGKPTAKPAKNNPNSSMVVYSSLDGVNDIYFQIVVEDMGKGYFLEKDTALFESYRSLLDNSKDCKVLSHTYDHMGDYPVMWSSFIRSNNQGSYYNKVLRIHRGNRAYYVVATTADSIKHRQLLNNFFQSFTLSPVDPGKWQLHQAPDKSFSLWSTTPLSRYVDSTAAEGEETVPIYEIFDPAAPATYYLRKEAYNPYSWYESDTALLRQMVRNTLEYSDTLLSYEHVTNGSYKGVEVMIGLPGNHNLKKMRLLIVGDSLFTLYSITSREALEQEDSRRVFTDLSVAHQTASTLFNNKADDLFKALRSGDSLTFEKAKEAIGQVTFTKKELPLLQEAFTYVYPDSADYNNTSKQLQREIVLLHDGSTLDMVKKTWQELPANREAVRYDLLDLLVDCKTQASVTLSRDLLLQRPPTRGRASYYFSSLSDSLQLVAPLLPSMLPLLKDSLAGPHLVRVIEDLIDSSLMDLKLLTTWKPQLYQLAHQALGKSRETGEMQWITDPSLIRVLAKLKDPAAYQLINRFLAQSDLDMKFIATTALLEGKQPVAPDALLKLAADLGQRNELYDLLVEHKKTTLFPVKYRTQKALAEAALYAQAIDETENAKLTYLGERTIIVKGVSQQYFLFKVEMSNEDETAVHLGVAGPYNSKAGKLLTESDRVGIYWTKEYNAKTVNADFKALLKEWEEYEQ